MSAESGEDTTRTVVTTYVPAYQRDEWDERADELGMSRSEFVRTMVQAGKRGFEDAGPSPDGGHSETEEAATGRDDDTQNDPDGKGGERPGSGPEDPTVDTTGQSAVSPAGELEDVVLDRLSTEQYVPWNELLAAVTEDIESRLEETLQTLQAADEIRYSGRHSGYTLDE